MVNGKFGKYQNRENNVNDNDDEKSWDCTAVGGDPVRELFYGRHTIPHQEGISFPPA